MKRKRDNIQDLTEEATNEEANVNENIFHLKFKTVCTITQHNELSSGFCLQSMDEFLLLRSKAEINVMKFERNLGNHQAKFRLSSMKFPVANYNVVDTVKVNDKKLFNMSKHSQKNDLMLNDHLNPRCVLKNVQVIKSLLSPSRPTSMLATLSSHGSVELSKLSYDEEKRQNSREKIAELCEIRRVKSLDNVNINLEKLQDISNDVSFKNFDWCPEFINSLSLIAAVTKNNIIIIFSINHEGVVVIEHEEKVENNVSSLKWFLHKNKQCLIIANSKGDLILYNIKFDGFKIESLKRKNVMKGKINIPISHIEIDCYDDLVLAICAKGHSLELFLINEDHVSSITKYIGLSVTGFVKSSLTHSHYLVLSLCNNIFFMDLKIIDNELKISSYEKIDNLDTLDIIPSKYSSYGIATSRNKVLVFIALYPKIMFDHLVLKQPLCLSVNILSSTDPYDMLLKNESFKLTDMHDCVEAVRHIATNSLTTLAPLESMKFTVEFSEEFLYYLKIQLLSYDASMTYYQTRSESLFEMFKTKDQQTRLLIETINAYFLLNSIISRKEKHSKLVVTSSICLKKFIEEYLQVEFEKDPFKTAKESLTNELKALLKKCKTLRDEETNEQCNFCQGKLNGGRICNNNHSTVRCSITKLQLPLSSKTICSNCQCCINDLTILKEITKKTEFFCIFCDRRL